MQIERYSNFYEKEEDIFLKNELRREYITNKVLRKYQVDIILPTYNRSAQLKNAIDSIVNQLHTKWSLYVCDDGSNDATPTLMESYKKDTRINYTRLTRRGVSSARNTGLEKVKGEYICFLDSDNSWQPEYLSLMLAFMDKFSLDSAYCAAKLIEEENQQWLGDIFNWEACVEKNYIDINCFITKSANKKARFDETLQRFVDWDYILEITREGIVSYLPIALVDYCNKAKKDRITNSIYQHSGMRTHYIKFIQDKHSKPGRPTNNKDARFFKHP